MLGEITGSFPLLLYTLPFVWLFTAFGALIMGAGTLIWGRNLWPAIVAHGLTDTLGFTLIYFGALGGHAT